MKKFVLTTLLTGLVASAAWAQTTDAPASETRKVKIVRVENGVTTIEERELGPDEPMMVLEEEMSNAAGGEHKVIVRHVAGGEKLSQEEMQAEIDKALREQGIDPAQAKGKMVIREVEVVNGDTLINSTEIKEAQGGAVIQWDAQDPELQKLLKEQGVNITEGDNGQVVVRVEAKDEGDGEKRVIVISRNVRVSVCDLEGGDCAELKRMQGTDPKESHNLKLKELAFHPNPNDGHFTVEFRTRNKKEPVHLRIFDLNGREVHTEDFLGDSFSKEMDLSSEPAGVYFLELSQAGEKLVKKVVVGQ